MNTLVFAIILVGAFLFSGCVGGSPPEVACTAEAKICPDGTAVGRVGPDCEFAPCPGGEIQEDSLFGHKWNLLEIDGEAIGENPAYIEFSEEEETFNGDAGCNNMGGSYTLDGDQVEFGQTMTTLMYCEQYMELEGKVLEKIDQGPYRWEVAGNKLNFYKGDQLVMVWGAEE